MGVWACGCVSVCARIHCGTACDGYLMAALADVYTLN